MKEVFYSFFVACLVLFATTAEAATLYIEPHDSEIRPGDTVALGVRINTDDEECINAVDGVINYPKNIVAVDVSLGNSIFPVWIEEPTIDKKNNRITFAGGIPNGYCGRIEGDPRLTNVLLELIIQAPGTTIGIGETSPIAHITFGDETQVLLNDGAGSQAVLRTLGATMFVHDRPGNTLIDDWNTRIAEDTSLPSQFSVSLNTDKSIFGGKYFIVFNTTDKQSGIDHYEIIEEPLDEFKLFTWGGVDAPWIRARSPYVLTDQSLNSTIRVKAVDKAGNEYIAILVPDEAMRGVTDRTIFSLGLFATGVLVLIVLGIALWVYRRKVRTYSDKEIETPATETVRIDEQ